MQEVDRKRLDAEARSEAPQGMIANAAPLRRRSSTTWSAAALAPGPFLVAVDGVTDPGNLGALLRSATAPACTAS